MAERTAKLGDLAVFVGSGVTPRGGEASYVSHGVLFIRSQNVQFGGLRLDDAVFITEATHRAMSRSAVLPEDVLLNITGASIGRVAMVPLGFPPANVNQHVCVIRVRRERIDPGYLAAFLASHDGQRQIWSLQAGLSRQALNYEQARAIEVPVPPLDEQRRIAAVLSAIDSRVAHECRVREASLCTLDSAVGALIERPSAAGDWPLRRLADVSERVFVGIAQAATHAYVTSGGVPIVRNTNVAPNRVQGELLRISEEFAHQMRSKALRAGDVLTARTGYPGTSAVVPPGLDGAQCFTLLVVRPGPDLRGTFLAYLMNSQIGRSIVRRGAAGGAQQNLNAGTYEGALVPVPPLPRQDDVVRCLDAMQKAAWTCDEVIVRLGRAKTAVASALLDGAT